MLLNEFPSSFALNRPLFGHTHFPQVQFLSYVPAPKKVTNLPLFHHINLNNSPNVPAPDRDQATTSIIIIIIRTTPRRTATPISFFFASNYCDSGVRCNLSFPFRRFSRVSAAEERVAWKEQKSVAGTVKRVYFGGGSPRSHELNRLVCRIYLRCFCHLFAADNWVIIISYRVNNIQHRERMRRVRVQLHSRPLQDETSVLLLLLPQAED